MNFDEARKFINSVRWQYAKTYPAIPHEYNIIDWDINKQEFTEFANFIIANGFDNRFYSKTYKYLILDEYKYWLMDEPNEATLINRSFIDDKKLDLIKSYVFNGNFVHKRGMSLQDILDEAKND